MSVATNLQQIKQTLPPHVRLVAVSKFQPETAILEAYQAGQRVFGESRARELEQKHERLPKDIEWHFIGTLQTNKIKYIIPYVSLIHSIDSFRLLEEVDRYAAKAGRVVDCLIQLHVAKETSKFGFLPDECMEMFSAKKWQALTHIRICGLMGMATNTEDIEQIGGEFCLLKKVFEEIKANFFADDDFFRELSMGMSHDYLLAVKNGSTLVRVGSSIFGERG